MPVCDYVGKKDPCTRMIYITICGRVKCKVFWDVTACRLINTVVIGSSKIRSVVMFSGKRTQKCVRCPLYLNVISLIRFWVLAAVHFHVVMSFRGTSRTSCLPTHIPENKKRDSRTVRLHLAVHTHSNIFPICVMNAYRGIEVYLRSFLTSAIEAGEWSSRSGHLTPVKELRHPRSVWLGGHRNRSGRFGGDTISFPCRESNCYSSLRPVTKSLFRLSYPNSWK